MHVEQERLLIPTREGEAPARSSSTPSHPKPKPEHISWFDLPNKPQLFLLALCRLSEPLSNVCLLPYIFYLVKSVLPPPPTGPHTSSSVRDDDASSSSSDQDHPSADSARISEYSGLLVAAFPLAQFLVSLAWGYFSDRHGRRTSILAGLFVSVVSNAFFGMSKSLAALFFWRTLAGLANGNVGLMRTMTAEVVRERRYQTKAFLLLPLVFNSGMVLSLALGGMLADPVANLPFLFGKDGILNVAKSEAGVAWALEYPYALPALMNAAMLGVAFVLSFLWLEETLPGKESHTDVGLRAGSFLVRLVRNVLDPRSHAEYRPLQNDEESPASPSSSSPSLECEPKLPDLPDTPSSSPPSPSPPPSQIGSGRASAPSSPPAPPPTQRLPFRKIWTRDVLTSMLAFGLLPLHNSAFMHIFPVYLATPHVDNSHATLLAFAGGLGLRSSTIGLWLSAFGIGGILLQLFIYPRMQARIGTLGVFKIALLLFPLVYALAPYLSLLPTDGVFRWIGLGTVICGQIMARTMAIPSTIILLTEAAPAKNVLGTVHGAGNMVASLARAVGPAVGGLVFAWGVHTGIVGAVWWLYLVCVSVAALIWTFTMQRPARDEN